MRIRLAVIAIAVLVLPACTMLPQACTLPAQAMISAELMFGRKIGDRVGVSEVAFAAFVAREITPRFPDGLTLIDAKGQWRDSARGILVREPSKLLLLTFADDPGKRADITAIADAYKRQFRQQSVLTSLRATCVTF
jgi:hypothetical protein